MKQSRLMPILVGLVVSAALASPALAHGSGGITLEVLGTYASGIFLDGGAEIVAFDPGTHRLFVTNAAENSIDVLDLADPTAPTLLFSIALSSIGAGVNSAAVSGGVVAVAIESDPKQAPGKAAFFDVSGTFLSSVTVGALPDMITFTPDGTTVLVANEGEPNDAYTVDPEGSVSVIDVSAGAAHVTQADVRTADFHAFDAGPLDRSVRVFGPGSTPSQDFEPEYIAVSADSRKAWVTLQENNAIAIIDISSATVVDVVGLGTKNHRRFRNGLDASNEDGRIRIRPWPVRGFYLPDAIAAFRKDGHTFLVTANEGDSRDYGGFSEEERVADLTLDPDRFPHAATLQLEENLGRLKVTSTAGDFDGDGDYDALFSFGARSFTIWTPWGRKLFDSGSQIELITAAALPDDFNSDNEENGSFDDRSDDKGPEPEGVVIGEVHGRTYLFVGLERIGGVVVFDLEDPLDPRVVTYVNNRDFLGDPAAGTAGDLGPEGLVFIPADDSPNGKPLLVIANEISGTTTIFGIEAH